MSRIDLLMEVKEMNLSSNTMLKGERRNKYAYCGELTQTHDLPSNQVPMSY